MSSGTSRSGACEAPDGADLAPGDLVTGIVRRPDPDPCPYCARGEFDMCRNGRYRERGIKERDGYGAGLVTLELAYAVSVDPSDRTYLGAGNGLPGTGRDRRRRRRRRRRRS